MARSFLVVLGLVCLCLGAQGKAFGRPMHQGNNDAPVQARLNLGGLNKDAPVQVRLNADAVAKLTAPVQVRLNTAALAKLSQAPVQARLNTDALAALAAQEEQEIGSDAGADAEAAMMDALQDAIASKLPTSVRLTDFSFQDCAAASAPAHVQQFSISPDPIAIPGPVNVSMKASLSASVTSPLSLAVKIQKKTKAGTWLTIPCYQQVVGSCTYPDVCKLLAQIPLVNGQCPPEMVAAKIPCRCPIPAAAINIPGIGFSIPALPPSIPAALVSGEFQINLAMNQGPKQVMCLNLILTVEDNS